MADGGTSYVAIAQAVAAAASAYAANRAIAAQTAAASQQVYEAKFYREHWQTYYSAAELEHVSEVCARGRTKPRYEQRRASARVETARAYRSSRAQLVRQLNRYELPSTRSVWDQLALSESSTRIEMVDRAWRAEENRALLLNAKMDDLLYRNAQLGRGMGAAGTAAGQLAATTVSQVAGGVSQLAGYALGRSMRGLGAYLNPAPAPISIQIGQVATTQSAASAGIYEPTP